MKNKLGQEPAFAALAIDKSIKSDEQTTEHSLNGNNGMSKRFYAACAAMQGLLANSFLTESISKEVKNAEHARFFIVRSSYQYADELLKQENNE